MFYTINQNNSGGYIIDNEDVSNFVSVEANNFKEAEGKLRSITEDYSEFCECCGERWYIDLNNDDAEEIPMIYDIPYNQEVYKCWSSEHIIIYYLDGIIEKVKLKSC